MAKQDHTFYREAKKSFLDGESFSWKSVFKKFLKYLKWALYTFLIMTSLWGCVNEFRHTTSGAVSQGIEFYSSYDSVIPNIYMGEESSHVYEMYSTGVDSETQEEVKEKIPFEFYTINPNFNPEITSEDKVENVNYDDLFIRSSDVTTSTGEHSTQPLSYTVDESTAQAYLYLYDWSFYNDGKSLQTETTDGVPWVLPYYTLPQYFYDLDNADINGDGSKNFVDFYIKIYGQDEALNNGLIKEDEDGNITSVPFYEKFIVPNDSLVNLENLGTDWWEDPANWEIIDGETDTFIEQEDWDNPDIYDTNRKNEVAYEQMVFYTNAASFISGKEFSSSDIISMDINGTQENISIHDLITTVLFQGTVINEVYTASFPIIQDIDLYKSDSSLTYELYSGLGYSIVSQNRAHPLYPSDSAINTFDNYSVSGEESSTGMRDPNWYENTEAGTQERTNNAGWAMLEEDGDFIEINNYSNSNTNYLYGDTQEDFNANMQKYRTSIDETGTNSGYYVNGTVNASAGIENGNSIGVDTQENFIGISSIGETSIDGGTYQYLTYDSTVYDAIDKSGQDGNNSDRDIFSSWNDWGDAWDPDYGPMYGLFVFPLSQLSIWVSTWFPYSTFGAWGVILGIFIITFMLRGIGLLLSVGSSKNQQKMQEIQPILAEVDAKYAVYDKKNKQMKAKKQQEKMGIYKKYEINPFASLGTVFITLPIFLSLFIIISAIPIYKIASVGAFSFSVSSFYGMFNISSLFIVYLLVGITVGFAQGISSKLPGWLANKRRGVKQVDEATKKALKKQRRTQNILVGVFVFIGLTVSVLLAIYWIFSALFTITNELTRHWLKERKAKKIAQGKV
ncbi:MAG: hypothetical protein HPAVJP_5940 [Candidatus Hepatoplasma vulgare]|nr:MAG: hypothetical protein HPAVJP_5940 [Candidatus Hepatoplasma sp.]